MNETRIPPPTPEQLLKLLDSQLMLARAKRTEDTSPRHTALLVGALLLIVGSCCAALLVLQQMLSDLRDQPVTTTPHNEQATGPNGNF